MSGAVRYPIISATRKFDLYAHRTLPVDPVSAGSSTGNICFVAARQGGQQALPKVFDKDVVISQSMTKGAVTAS